MKRKLIPFLSVAVVALGALIAQAGTASAHRSSHHFGGGFFGQGTVVKGTVVSVDTTAGTFTATVSVCGHAAGGGGFGVGGSFGSRFFQGRGDDGDSQGWGPGFRSGEGFQGGAFAGRFHSDQMMPPGTTSTPTAPSTTPTTVTITTNSSTKFDVNGNTSATIANLAAGDRFIATFAPSTSQGTSTTMGSSLRRPHWDQGAMPVPTTPALQVIAESPPQLYAFIGTVAAAPTGLPGSLQVTVQTSLPSGLFSGTQTFQIGPQTLVFGGSLSSIFGSTPAIAQGDVVVGGEINMSGLTAAQVEANPLQVLVDFTSTTPAMTTPTTPAASTPAATAMAKRMRSASFDRALKRLVRHHRTVHHAKAHRQLHA